MNLTWPMNVPVLSDGVVTLRAHVPGDVERVMEMSDDPQTQRWTTVPLQNDRALSEQFVFEHIPRGWDEGTYFGWAIEVGGRFAGNIDVRGTPIADLGFALHPDARGQGAMARAVRLANDWAFSEGGIEVVHWRTNVGNEASLRVAHSTGFTLHGVSPGLLDHRGTVVDAWTGSIRFGDAPFATRPWAEAPVLESRRLHLRPFKPSDVPRLIEACSDPDSRHWLRGLPSPYTPAVAAAYLADTTWNAALGAKATWCVADRATDQLIGNIAVMDLLGLGADSGEIGYWMHPDARGRGVMTEAVGMVVPHALDPDGLDRRRLSLYAAAGNAASNAIAVANGFRFYGTQHAAEPLGDGTHDDLHGYELLRQD
ncbi:GNAT family N-acetyltransferase [Aeromicrobium sp. CF3.5]|uniref:GNAT family N-acetyltransferase n=1 Tax=Aeromicrobium sp. CF3.5 TaxID=3373078 RepID=UPI003EE65284